MNTVGSRELNLNVYDSIKYEDKYDYYKELFAKRKKELEALKQLRKQQRLSRLKKTIVSIILLSTLFTNAKGLEIEPEQLKIENKINFDNEEFVNEQIQKEKNVEDKNVEDSKETVSDEEITTTDSNDIVEVNESSINNEEYVYESSYSNLNLDEKTAWILDTYNLTYDEFVVLNAIVNAEAKADSYDDAYAVINTLYNRINSYSWINYVDSIMGDGCGYNLYYQATCPGQFEVYATGMYLDYLYDTYPNSDQAVIDMLYNQNIMHNYLSFKSAETYVEDSVQFVPGGNNYHNYFYDSDRTNEYIRKP